MSSGDPFSPQPRDVRESGLRQRIALYEGFDEIINENVRRSRELLREAEQRHAEATEAATSARLGQRAILEELATEATALARMAESLAARIDAALRSVDGQPAPRTAPATPEAPDVAQELEAEALSGVGEPVEPAASTGVAETQPGGKRVLELVVHGIPDLAAAHELRRAIASAEAVESAAVREYTGGMMRITLEPREILTPERLRSLAAPFAFEEIDRGPSVIAVRIVPEQK